VPAIYRVHAQPDPTRIERLVEQLAALGVPTPPLGQGLSAQQAGRVAAEASRLARREAARRGHGREAYTSLVLRSLKQAAYSERNSGHAGLGSSAYTHFTSPIRRYADLVVHRALLAALGEGEEPPRLAEARDVAADCSARERESMKIERGADDVCAAYLLERELGERGPDAEFEGEVSGVIRAGAFVSFAGELGDVYEGMLPARRLPGGRPELDRAEVALVNRGSKAALRLGDPVKLRVTGVDPVRGRVDLELAGG
jgi:ribonuclease R